MVKDHTFSGSGKYTQNPEFDILFKCVLLSLPPSLISGIYGGVLITQHGRNKAKHIATTGSENRSVTSYLRRLLPSAFW